MQTRRTLLPALLAALVIQACAAPLPRDSSRPDPPLGADSVISTLDRHLSQLSRSIEGVNDRITQLKQMPATNDPIIRELRALDLTGWQLHQQQWILQQEHLRYAREQLRRAQDHPDARAQIQQEWTAHEQEFESAIEDFRQQRQSLEKKRLQVEAQLIEQHLR